MRRKAFACHGKPARLAPLALCLLVGAACREKPACVRCDTLVLAATAEPATLIPPLVLETVGRDVSDFVFERLALLRPGGSPVDPTAFDPGLAVKWERIDSLGWRFELRPNARWQDGKPVTPDDVRFSFQAFVDTALGEPAGVQLAGVVAEPDGPTAVRVRFPRPHPEQLFDATYYVRVLPRHVLDPIERSAWGGDSSIAQLIGSGPFRVREWRRGQSLILERTAPVTDPGGINRLVWRFTEDQDAALNLVLAGEADVIETLTSPAARTRARADSSVTLLPYPAAATGFLVFKRADETGRTHPVLADRAVRRALTMAIDRPSLVKAVIGEGAVPPGPISRAVWIWNDSVRRLPYDTAGANALLDSAGWRRGAGGVRSKAGRALALDILVPSTSAIRRQMAEVIEQQWKALGAEARITAVDFPVFQQRLRQGRFDTMIGASLDEPSPRSLADQWTEAGFGIQNFGRYHNRSFDSLFARASGEANPVAGRQLWREAFDTLNADPPAVFLYTPTNVAVVSRRISGVAIDPFSWLAGAGGWKLSR
jgi:peptide/nickel transport system substrate-binding protein